MSAVWLPPLVLLEDAGGDWNAYEDQLYGWFRRDFIDSKPRWPRKRVGLKRHPLSKGKEATFWHFISEGTSEADRLVDVRRCERIRWPRAMMDYFQERPPREADRLLWWRSQGSYENRYVLALPDFSYVAVVADRGEFVLPWTAYCVERDHRRVKLRKEFVEYWRAQNG